METINATNAAFASAHADLVGAFKKYGTQWPEEYGYETFDLWRANEVERMFKLAPYFMYCKPERDSALLAEQIAAAAHASGNCETLEDSQEAATEVSVAITYLGEAMGISFTS